MISLARQLALRREVEALFDDMPSDLDGDERMGDERGFLHIHRATALEGEKVCRGCGAEMPGANHMRRWCSRCRTPATRKRNLERVLRAYWAKRATTPCVYCGRLIDDPRTAGQGPSHPTCLDWARYAHELTHRAKRTQARHAAHAARPCADCGGPTGRTCGNALRCEPCATARNLRLKRERALRYYHRQREGT